MTDSQTPEGPAPQLDREVDASGPSKSNGDHGNSIRPKSWPEKLQLVWRRSDQWTLAILIVVSFLIMAIYVTTQFALRQRLIDIDDAAPKKANHQVDINSATWPELANLPGIGEGTAKAVIRYREQNGDFQDVNEMIRVPGIGPKKLEAIEQYLVVRTGERSPSLSEARGASN